MNYIYTHKAKVMNALAILEGEITHQSLIVKKATSKGFIAHLDNHPTVAMAEHLDQVLIALADEIAAESEDYD